MNERIKELIESCRTLHRNGKGNYDEQFDEEKFAELLLKECLKQCQQELYVIINENTEGFDSRHIGIHVGEKIGVMKCMDGIKKRFGMV
jgi:aromatic ring-cleaving dioxygenase